MKYLKTLIAIFIVCVSLFISNQINSEVYVSDTGWDAGGPTIGYGRTTSDEPLLDDTGKEIGRVVGCQGDQWICWQIDGNNLYVDPTQPGPRGIPTQIFKQ